jgi:ferrous iron transport protein A
MQELDIDNSNTSLITHIFIERRVIMMPLSMVKQGEPNIIQRVGGKEETRRFLENLGFVSGAEVTVVSTTNGNMIVNVKDSRIAIGKDMANKIMVN